MRQTTHQNRIRILGVSDDVGPAESRCIGVIVTQHYLVIGGNHPPPNEYKKKVYFFTCEGDIDLQFVYTAGA